ncbi:hypothetical protein P3342_002999 [Pyrenophora teres f. teres]|nr:hypothetical protein P3342_002999 [Pyrenophora teres f. teres]
MLLRRDVMVGFLGLSSASAAACTLLAPEWWTGWGRTRFASDAEWSEGTDETVEAEAEGEAAALDAVLGEFVLVGAAMVGAALHCGAMEWMVGGWTGRRAGGRAGVGLGRVFGDARVSRARSPE